MNTNIINVITKDFSFVNHALETSSLDNIADSLNFVNASLKNCAKSIEDIKSKLTNDNVNTIFIPYLKETQFLTAIKDLSEGIIIVSGIDDNSVEMISIKNKAWVLYKKILIADETNAEMVKNHTDVYVSMYLQANERKLSCKDVPGRNFKDKDDRYALFVDLAQQKLSMKEIAVQFGFSIPAVYWMRTEFKERLLADENVSKFLPALKFVGKNR
jgi:hypothetical protein